MYYEELLPRNLQNRILFFAGVENFKTVQSDLGSTLFHFFFIDVIEIKENKERGSCGNGRLLIHLYYSAVTGNRKQVLTGSSESCEHKCR